MKTKLLRKIRRRFTVTSNGYVHTLTQRYTVLDHKKGIAYTEDVNTNFWANTISEVLTDKLGFAWYIYAHKRRLQERKLKSQYKKLMKNK